jgi:pentatricopeptide repeat protein
MEKGMRLHMELIRESFEEDLFVGSSVVSMYAKSGFVIEAQDIFDELPVRDIVVWNSLLAGYAEHGLLQDASRCLEDMKVDGILPDATSLTYFLKMLRVYQCRGKGIRNG